MLYTTSHKFLGKLLREAEEEGGGSQPCRQARRGGGLGREGGGSQAGRDGRVGVGVGVGMVGERSGCGRCQKWV